MSSDDDASAYIKIFLPDGRPDGLRIISKSNWNGRALAASRTELASALARPELEQAGVYLLTGIDDEGEPRIYIGEADNLKKRLAGNKKTFWTQAFIFSSIDGVLNKAHARHLEGELIRLAKQAKRWTLENKEESGSSLTEPERAFTRGFLREMLTICKIMGIDAFSVPDEPAQEHKGAAEIILRQGTGGVEARGRSEAGGVLVLKGSRARLDERPSVRPRFTAMRAELVERGVLVRDGENLLFSQDYWFASPSTAAAVLVGGDANGMTDWRTEDGRSLATVLAAQSID